MKDPKVEAQRLFDMFYNGTLTHLSDHNTKDDARLSALLCVDEIYSVYQKLTPNDDPYCFLMQFEFLYDVKQELKKL